MNRVIFAPAGGRKTQSIIDLCQMGVSDKRRLIVTFTTTGQNVIEQRLWNCNCTSSKVEVQGWYSFLLNNFIRPYIYDLFPGQSVSGLHFVDGEDPTLYKKGVKRYFDRTDKVYSNNIGKLAKEISLASNGACLDRLHGIYDTIYFDEVQDLVGNDLEILEMLLRTNIEIIAVGDVRQSILRTSRTDRKNNTYNGLQKIVWFRQMEAIGLCKIEEINTTWRCNQKIIDFADSVLPKDLKFPSTNSMQKMETDHDGIFVVEWSNVKDYLMKYNPEPYRHSVKSKIIDGGWAINFGLSKGKTVPRVLIYPTEPIKKFLKNQDNKLTEQSASMLYVAITRAIHSVAIVVDKPSEYSITEWKPD